MQVITASNGKVFKNKSKLHSPYPGEPGSPSSSTAALCTDYQIDHLKFRVYFSFHEKDRELNLIELVLLDNKQCPALGNSLLDLYGKPFSEKDTSGLRSSSWRDEENNNMITFFHMLNCYIRYEPIQTSDKAN
jgi:hypothetical protein